MNQVQQISAKFSKIINEWLSKDELQWVQAGLSPDEFCDSNAAMNEAFKSILFRDINVNDSSDLCLVNNARDLSILNMFG